MSRKLEVKRQEFHLLSGNLGAFKKFLTEIPNHAKVNIDVKDNGTFFSTYWIGVTEDAEEEIADFYQLNLPHICLYGKLAHDLVDDYNPQPGIPWHINAEHVSDISKGFIEILIRRMADFKTSYIIAESWGNTFKPTLEETAHKYLVPIKEPEEEDFH